MLKYESIREIADAAAEKGLRIGELVLHDQAEAMELSPLELYEKMEMDFYVMADSVKAGQEKNQKSMSGLTGGEGYKMKTYAEKKQRRPVRAFSGEGHFPRLGRRRVQRLHGPDRGRADGGQLRHFAGVPGVAVGGSGV